MIGGEVLAAVGTVIAAGAVWLAKYLAGKKEDVTKERQEKAERDMISTLERERDEYRGNAKAEREQRLANERMIARLEEESLYLKRRLAMAMRAIPDEKRRIIDTAFSELDGLPAERRK